MTHYFESLKRLPTDAHLFLVIYCGVPVTFQSLFEETAAAERSEGDAEELCCLP